MSVMAPDGHYSVGEIVQLHLYHCLDCLVEDLTSGRMDCGCDTEMLVEFTADYMKKMTTSLPGDYPNIEKLWAAHIADAIKEYAG